MFFFQIDLNGFESDLENLQRIKCVLVYLCTFTGIYWHKSKGSVCQLYKSALLDWQPAAAMIHLNIFTAAQRVDQLWISRFHCQRLCKWSSGPPENRTTCYQWGFFPPLKCKASKSCTQGLEDDSSQMFKILWSRRPGAHGPQIESCTSESKSVTSRLGPPPSLLAWGLSCWSSSLSHRRCLFLWERETKWWEGGDYLAWTLKVSQRNTGVGGGGGSDWAEARKSMWRKQQEDPKIATHTQSSYIIRLAALPTQWCVEHRDST